MTTPTLDPSSPQPAAPARPLAAPSIVPAPAQRVAVVPATVPPGSTAAAILTGLEGVQLVRVGSLAAGVPSADVLLVALDRAGGADERRLAALRAQPEASGTAVVLVAAAAVLRDVLPRAHELGVVECLRTPLEPGEVRLRVRAALRLQRLARRVSDAARAHDADRARLEDAANHDPLTGLCNRRGLDRRLREEVTRARQLGRALSVVVADIDRFKQVNDTHGHAIGDVLLASVAGVLRRCVRDGDTIARLGGEEFVVLAPGTDEKGVAVLAERLRATLAIAPLFASTRSGAHATLRVTASFGTATVYGRDALDPEDTAAALFEAADAALYRAKERGRNCVESAAAL